MVKPADFRSPDTLEHEEKGQQLPFALSVSRKALLQPI
jgi:hypothetical protein